MLRVAFWGIVQTIARIDTRMLESQHMLRRDGQVRAGQLRVRARHGRMTPGSCLAQGAITETRRWNWGTPARPAPARPPAPAPARHARPVNSGRPPAGCRACDSSPHRAPHAPAGTCSYASRAQTPQITSGTGGECAGPATACSWACDPGFHLVNGPGRCASPARLGQETALPA